MFKDIDLQPLRKMPGFAYYFRYDLHHSDFYELRENGRLLGRIAAKPLYGKLEPNGKVDKSSGFNGEIAVIFIPARSKSVKSARLLMTKIPRDQIVKSDGKRNWPLIRAAADEAVLRSAA